MLKQLYYTDENILNKIKHVCFIIAIKVEYILKKSPGLNLLDEPPSKLSTLIGIFELYIEINILIIFLLNTKLKNIKHNLYILLNAKEDIN